MKNAFFKLIAITLAVVMLSLCLFSCDDTTSSDGSDTNTGNNVTQNEGSSDSSDNGNTDNGGNNGENNGENNGDSGENGGNNTDSERVSKLKYNNTVAKTSYAVISDYVFGLVKFTFNEEGKFLGVASGLLPNDLYIPFEIERDEELSRMHYNIRIIYNADGVPNFLNIPISDSYDSNTLIKLKPSSNNGSFEGSTYLGFDDKDQFAFKLTVDSERKITSVTVASNCNGVLDESICFKFDGTDISCCKIVSADWGVDRVYYDTMESTYSKTANIVMATIRYTEGKTGVVDTNVVKMETKQESDSYTIEVQGPDGFTNLYIDRGNYVSATTSNGMINYTYTYNADGKLTLWNMGNGERISFSYDEKGILTTAELMLNAVGNVEKKCTYNYDDDGFLIDCITEKYYGKVERRTCTVDFVSKTYTISSRPNSDDCVCTYMYKMGAERLLYELHIENFDTNNNKLDEIIIEIEEPEDDSKYIIADITINCWCDYDDCFRVTDSKYIGYLYKRFTGEEILDIKTYEVISINIIIDTFDANGNVISSKTSTDLDILGML